MKNKMALLLVCGGVVIAGIAILGNSFVSKKSDAELIQEAIFEQNRIATEKRTSAAELSKKILQTPEACQGLTAKFIFDYGDLEPDDFVSWPDWTQTANPAEQDCIVAAFHKTNAHAFAIQGKEYAQGTPVNLSVANFISDIGSATLFTDGIDYGDPDASLFDLISGYFADRAESRVSPGHDY